jgi:transposase
VIYEAGRDGFWLHRQLASLGIVNHVVDAASIEVSRRARRAKTDRLDAEALLEKLIRYAHGERRVWRVVRVRTLMLLPGIGWVGAWTLVLEIFGWRAIRNRRELAALVGLVPTPYNSGTMAREQGISKAGNPRVRALLIQLAWLWLRYQPQGVGVIHPFAHRLRAIEGHFARGQKRG